MTNSSERTRRYDQIGSAVRHLKFLRDDEVAAFQGLFLLAPKMQKKLVYRLSTEQTPVLLRMAREHGRFFGCSTRNTESAKIAGDFSFLINVIRNRNNKH